MKKVSEIIQLLKPDRTYRFRVIALCFLAAATFWFLNALNEDYSATVRYPLEFIYDQEKYVAVDRLPEYVQLNVTGLGWNLLRNNLGIKVTPIQIPLDNPLETKKISGAAMPGYISDQLNEFDLNYVITDTISLNIDRTEDRLFHIHLDSLTVDLEDDYRITSPVNITPDTLRIYGPATVLAELGDTLALNLPQDNVDENYKEIVLVTVTHPKAALLSRNPPTVEVAFDVAEFVTNSRRLTITPENMPEGASISPTEMIFSYVVQAEQAEEIKPTDFILTADFKNMNREDSSIIPVISKMPQGISDIRLDSVQVQVLFNEED